MALIAVKNTSLADNVFKQLTAEIVSGRYAPGSTIPSERALSEVFSVNRHVVREATKRLEQIGLVTVVQGGGTKVLDLRATAGLDLLAVLAEHVEAVDSLLPLLNDVLEMRASNAADMARLCALRGSKAVGDQLVEIADQLATVTNDTNMLALEQRFWQVVLDGADNLAYQLAFNSLMRGILAIPELSIPWLRQELGSSDYRRPIAAAIATGDADGAEKVTRVALAPDPKVFESFLRTSKAATG